MRTRRPGLRCLLERRQRQLAERKGSKWEGRHERQGASKYSGTGESESQRQNQRGCKTKSCGVATLILTVLTPRRDFHINNSSTYHTYMGVYPIWHDAVARRLGTQSCARLPAELSTGATRSPDRSLFAVLRSRFTPPPVVLSPPPSHWQAQSRRPHQGRPLLGRHWRPRCCPPEQDPPEPSPRLPSRCRAGPPQSHR